jgi:hypothetical protein
LVPKFHVALHASHVALPMVKSKFRPIVALQMLVQNFTIMKPFQRNTKIKSFTLCQIYLYQKDERALPGNLQTGDNVSCPPLNVVSLTTSPHIISLSLFLRSRGNDSVNTFPGHRLGTHVPGATAPGETNRQTFDFIYIRLQKGPALLGQACEHTWPASYPHSLHHSLLEYTANQKPAF